MSRNVRVSSESSIYHVILRGINKQQIFLDEEDYCYFTETLKRYKYVSGFKVFAYCLMGNHVHLLIKVGEESLSTVFRRIGTSFVYWYNTKYDRTGHLFQDRFRSEPVENERYFMTVVRYILHNPVKAGLCSSPSEYKYSSAGEYLERKRGITDTDYARSIFGDGIETYINAFCDDKCLDIQGKPLIRCNDSDAIKLIIDEFGTLSPEVGNVNNRDSFGKSIRRIKKAGVSVRQLSRLSGISKNIIERELKRGSRTESD